MPQWLDTLDTLRLGAGLRGLEAPKALKKPKSISDYALGAGMAIGRPILSGLEEVGDIISRPVTALSEAYGAHEAEKPILPAAGRGFWKGPSKAKYPTFGERIVPEEEGEGTGRKLLRLGAEIATDPTTYVGPGLVKAVGKGAVVGTKLAAGTKLIKGLSKSDTAQAFGRLLMPLKSNVEFFGGKAGKSLAGRAGRSEDRIANWLARTNTKLVKAAEGLTPEQRLKAVDFYESGDLWRGLKSGDEAVDRFSKHLDRYHKSQGRMAQSFRDEYGMPLLTRTANPVKPSLRTLKKKFTFLQGQGKLTPGKAIDLIAKRGNVARSTAEDIVNGNLRPFDVLRDQFGQKIPYYAQVLKEDVLRQAGTPVGLQKAAEGLAKRLRISKQEAETILRQQGGIVRKAGNIEYARLSKLPQDMLERDPLKVLPRYSERLFRRVSTAREFGIENQRLEKGIQAAIDAGLNPQTATLLRNAVQGVKDPRWLDKLAPSLLGFQALTKMGPTSSITNLSQRANAHIAFGTGNYVRGTMRLMKDPAFKERSLLAANAHLRAQMRNLVGEAGTAEKLRGLPTRFLRTVGFNWVEKGNRSISYAAGVASAENLAKEAGFRLTPRLRAMGVEARDLGPLAKFGKFTTGAERRIGLKAAKDTQFVPGYLELPPLWQTPEARILFQFKSFIHQQSRFLANHVIRPAARYFETGGKEGDIGPLMRALIAYPVAGQGVAALRELFQEQTAKLTGAKRRKPRKFDDDHPVVQLVKDSMYVGAFGLGGDILNQASQGRLLDYLAGPTVGDITQNLEFGARHLAQAKAPGLEDILARLYRHTPGRRMLPLEPQELAGAATRAMR